MYKNYVVKKNDVIMEERSWKMRNMYTTKEFTNSTSMMSLL